MAERLRCGTGTKIRVSSVPGWLLQWKRQDLVAPWSTCRFSVRGVVVVQHVRVMNSVFCCPHKCLGRLVRGKKGDVCSLITAGPEGSGQPGQHLSGKKGTEEEKQCLQGEHKANRTFCVF